MGFKLVDNHNMSAIDVQSLNDASELIKNLLKKYSHKEVIKKTGLDKNVIYRLENEQNVTLTNFLKIKNAFPEVFGNGNVLNKGVGRIPIIGQIIDDEKVRPLNPTQPTEFTAPITLIKRFSPTYAYVNVSQTGYNSCVHIFSTADIDYTRINSQCMHRLILAFSDNDASVYFGYVEKVNGIYELKSTKTKETKHTYPLKNNVSWAKWICMLPMSMMEYAEISPEHKYYLSGLKHNDDHWTDNIKKLPNKDNQ